MIRTTLNWTVKNLKSMYDEKETLSFNHPIQRQSAQWDNEQQSLLIHSMLANFPVPAVYVHKTESIEVGIDCATVELEDVTLVMSSNCIFKWFKGCEDYYIGKAINALCEQNAKPKYLKVDINIPADFEEKQLGKVIKNK